MYGCNNFCTYCIVPYVRGRERSREKDVILREARQMIEGGFRDITLLGQNVNSYGKTLAEPVSFAQLIREIDAIDGDYWLRFMTSHPKDCSRELIDAIAESRHISKHLHLPFQSGSDRILKAMNRHSPMPRSASGMYRSQAILSWAFPVRPTRTLSRRFP